MSLLHRQIAARAARVSHNALTARVGAEGVPTGSAESSLGLTSMLVGGALIVGAVYYYKKSEREAQLRALRYDPLPRYHHATRERAVMYQRPQLAGWAALDRARNALEREEAIKSTLRDRDAGPTVIVLGRRPETWEAPIAPDMPPPARRPY